VKVNVVDVSGNQRRRRSRSAGPIAPRNGRLRPSLRLVGVPSGVAETATAGRPLVDDVEERRRPAVTTARMTVRVAVAEDVRQLAGRRRPHTVDAFGFRQAPNRVVDRNLATVTAWTSTPDSTVVADVIIASTDVEVWRCIVESTDVDSWKFDASSGGRSDVAATIDDESAVQVAHRLMVMFVVLVDRSDDSRLALVVGRPHVVERSTGIDRRRRRLRREFIITFDGATEWSLLERRSALRQ